MDKTLSEIENREILNFDGLDRIIFHFIFSPNQCYGDIKSYCEEKFEHLYSRLEPLLDQNPLNFDVCFEGVIPDFTITLLETLLKN